MQDSISTSNSRSGWKWLLALGLVMIAIGVLAAFNPLATGIATGLLVGLTLIMAGVSMAVAAWSDHGLVHRLVDLLFALLLIAGGAYAIYNPLAGAVSLAWLIGAAFAAVGVLEIISALRAMGRRWSVLLLGIVDVLIGIYVLFSLPQIALLILAVLVGVSFILRGVILTFLALQARKLGRPLEH